MPDVECGPVAEGKVYRSQLLIIDGPIITVDIGFHPENVPPGQPMVEMAKGVRALIDTGATDNCIDNVLAAQLGLPAVREGEVVGIAGPIKAAMYSAQIHVPDFDYTNYGAFSGAPLAESGLPYAALIGRRFLRKFKMVYNGATGSVIISPAQGGS